MRDRLTGVAVAAASGVLWALCFGRETSVWLGWVALAPLLALLAHPRLDTKRAFLLGLVHGFVFWMITVGWIPRTIHVFGNVALPLAWFFLALLALFMALFRAFFAVLAHRLLRRGPAPALLLVPAVWVISEWLYGNALGSGDFPWNLAAYAWVDVPGTLPLAAWIGPWGVSYLVLWVNVGLALAWRRRRPLAAGGAAAAATVLAALLLLALALRWSGDELARRPPSGSAPGRPVRLVQPDQTLQAADAAVIRRQYEQLVGQSFAECRSGEPTLLIWPESAAWPFTWDGTPELRHDLGELASRGCSVVLNTPTLDARRPGSYFNSALLVTARPSGGAAPAGRYHKRYLVPFGETVPLGNVLPFVGKLARLAGDFSRGRGPGLLEWNGERLGLAICYEVVFPGAVVEQVRRGATLLVNISNDAWYGDTSAPRQLLRAGRFRAAENRRMMLRAALTGISAVIGPRGEVLARLDLGERGVLRRRVAGRAGSLTPYARLPWLVPLASAVLTLLGVFLAGRGAPVGSVGGRA